MTLNGANPMGGNYVANIDRRVDLAAYNQNYNPGAEVKAGTYPLIVRFYSQSNGLGSLVATASATVTVAADGTGIGTVTVANTVQSVVVNPGQSLVAERTKQLAFTGRDAQSNLVAVSPGSATWSVVSGSNLLTLSADGMATGVSGGAASVSVSLDGKSSAATAVTVVDDPSGEFNIITFDDLVPGVSADAGTDVPAAARLTTQYRSKYGVSFTSAPGYVAVVNLALRNNAPTAPNGISASTMAGTVEYNQSNPIQLTFTDPSNPTKKGVTRFVSVAADLDGKVSMNTTLQA
ncbi:MAG: hypothetical protein ABUL72_03575, partial [Armatimonadota bacterium]